MRKKKPKNYFTWIKAPYLLSFVCAVNSTERFFLPYFLFSNQNSPHTNKIDLFYVRTLFRAHARSNKYITLIETFYGVIIKSILLFAKSCVCFLLLFLIIHYPHADFYTVTRQNVYTLWSQPNQSSRLLTKPKVIKIKLTDNKYHAHAIIIMYSCTHIHTYITRHFHAK